MSSKDIKQYTIFGIICVIIIACGIVYSRYMALPEKIRKQKRMKRMVIIYRILKSFPFTKKYTRNCYMVLRDLAVTTEDGLRELTAQTAMEGIISGIIVALIGMYLFDDPICIAMVIVAGFLVKDKMLSKRRNRLSLAILDKMSIYIGLLREEYLRTNSVIESLQSAEKPSIIASPIEDIIRCIEGAETESALNEFIERASNTYMKTLAIACVRVNDLGDEVDNTGEPVFIKVLGYLQEDVYAEIERIDYLRRLFGSLGMMCLAPLLAVKALPAILSSFMPGLTAFYGGMAGNIVNIVGCVSAVIGYYLVNLFGEQDGVKEDDRSVMIERMLKHKWALTLATKCQPKLKARRKLDVLRQQSLSSKSNIAVTMERILIAVVAFIVTILIGFVSTHAQGTWAYKNTQTMALMANDDTAAYGDAFVLEMDKQYINILKERADGDRLITAKELMDDSETGDFILSHMPDMTELQKADQITRLQKKYDLIQGAYFKWYFVLLAYAVAIVAYQAPIWMLKFRRWNIYQEEEVEFLSIQTLCQILASAEMDTMDCLGEMYKMAKLYKEPLLTCYLNYCVEPHRELARLESKTVLSDFKRMIKKLDMAVDEVSLKEAFDGMEIERKHITTMRIDQNRRLVENRRAKAGYVAKLPIVIVIIGLLVAPICYVGFVELSKTLKEIGGI